MELKSLELELLRYWQSHGVKQIYKYKNHIKNRTKSLHEGDRVNMELFTDMTEGAMFTDVEDVMNFTNSKERKAVAESVDELIQRRQG